LGLWVRAIGIAVGVAAPVDVIGDSDRGGW
jgi:hypothetical protein